MGLKPLVNSWNIILALWPNILAAVSDKKANKDLELLMLLDRGLKRYKLKFSCGKKAYLAQS